MFQTFCKDEVFIYMQSKVNNIAEFIFAEFIFAEFIFADFFAEFIFADLGEIRKN